MKLFSPGSGCALLVLLLSVLSCCSLMQALLPQVREQGPPTTLNGSELAARVVRAATEMGKHLSGNPDTQYHPERFPQNVLTYWNQVCPVSSDCYSLWQPGRLQCVFLVTGAYAAAGAPLPAAPNASDFWEVYAHFPGWQRIPVGKGLPAPGDILVWRGGTYGHVAIVREITRPTASHPGKLTFIQANGPRAFDEHSLLPSLHPVTWPGFEVLGYLRPIAQLGRICPTPPMWSWPGRPRTRQACEGNRFPGFCAKSTRKAATIRWRFLRQEQQVSPN
uniref:Peptidase C51 domain-containing protein n=1 Tax=Thermosporothrix sp. COM3 TaxID=2490863 RepID=A0A455SVN9_9CHLR|nr:hypothetical protein KTC_64910 [Thermosporothrix sp. COM3]